MLTKLLNVINEVDEMATHDDKLMLALIEAGILTPMNEIIMRINDVMRRP